MTALGLVLRGWHLEQRGLLGHDEAVHLFEARYILDGGGEERPGTAHPVHTALLVAGSRIAGWSDRTGLGVSALCGAATIPVVAGIGRAAVGSGAGLLAAAALAVSPYHVRYSRTVSPDAAATCLLSLAAWAALSCRRSGAPWWRGAVAAAFASASALTHYRYAGAAAAAAGLVMWWGWKSSGFTPGGGRRAGSGALFGALLPVCLVEIWYLLFRLNAGHGPHPYWRQLAWRVMEYQGVFTLEEPLSQARHLLMLEGPLVVLLALAGTAVCARRARGGDGVAAAILAWTWAPFLFWSVYSGGGLFPRCLVMALPGVALLAGYAGAGLAGALARIPGWGGRARVVSLLALGAVVVAFSSRRVGAEVRAEGGYRHAARALAHDIVARGRPARLHWYHGPVWRFYLLEAGREIERPVESLLEVVRTTAPPSFFNYAIVDPFVYYLGADTRARLDRLMRVARPLGAWPNTWADDPIVLRDMVDGPRRLAEAGGPRDLSRLLVYRWPG